MLMEQLSLDYLVREPKIKTDNPPLLILLHGYGSNEHDLFSFANELPAELLIISAKAPLTIMPNSYAWYTIHLDNSEGKFSDIPQALKSRETIAYFIDEIKERYAITEASKTFLLGFSQGTILSYAVALNYPEKVQHVIALSGYINHELLPEVLDNSAYKNLDFFVSHGTVDQVLPLEWGQKAAPFLKSLNIDTIYHEYPVGHGVAPQNFYDLKNWIEDRIS